MQLSSDKREASTKGEEQPKKTSQKQPGLKVKTRGCCTRSVDRNRLCVGSCYRFGARDFSFCPAASAHRLRVPAIFARCPISAIFNLATCARSRIADEAGSAAETQTQQV